MCSLAKPITDQEDRPALHFVDIDPPTITMGILVNDSPLAGRDGKLVTARNIRERLVRETRTSNPSRRIGFKETEHREAAFRAGGTRRNADRGARRADAP